MPYQFEIFKDTREQYRWRFKAPNGEIVAQSEGYVSKYGAQQGVNVLKQHAGTATVEDLT